MRAALFTVCALASGAVAAGEGMWLPAQLPEIAPQLEAAGFKGSADDLADLSRAPLSAVVSLGGCTASFVSPQGLLLTNHHCAFGAIQLNSGAGRNRMAEGFNAATHADELSAGPAARVFVTVASDRITDRVLAAARGTTGRAYFDAVEAAGKAAVAECEADPGHRCSVADMSAGSDFHLVKQLELRDIRLVYAPPESIGNYGDDVDNFVWPRHVGDFTFLRAYVGTDGKPAAFDPANVPYAPPAHLQVATGPLAPGDFMMLAGYPGRTFRHRTAGEFADQVDWQLPARVESTAGLIQAIESATEGDEARAVLYAASLAGLKNTLKRAQGELEGLRRSDAVSARREDEAAMLAWLSSQPGAAAARADILAAQAVLDEARSTRERDQWLAGPRPLLMASALTLQRLAGERRKPDSERQPGYQLRDEAMLEGTLRQVQRRYHPEVEKAFWRHLLSRHRALPADQRIAEVDAVFGSDPASSARILDRLYARTTLDTETERMRWFKAPPDALAGASDPLLQAAARLLPAILRHEAAGKARE
ncbi:MAG TPA: S46 family peptidase, partial [Luteimonas sp.]|nr:S46 family peptidase [Luteimonas sp.]